MDKMTKLLESLDPELFSKEFKDNLVAIVNEKNADSTLELKELHEQRVLKLAEEYEAKISELTEKYDAKISEAQAKFEEKNTAELQEFKDEIVNALDEYLEYVSDEVINESKEAIMDKAIVDEAIEVHKIFDRTLQEYHVSVNNIGVKIEESEVIADLKKSLNEAVNEAIALKNEKKSALAEKATEKRKSFISEIANTISILTDREKFTKIAENFKDGDDFEERVKELAEGYVKKSVKSTPEEITLPVSEKTVVEEKTVPVITEDPKIASLREGFEGFFTEKKYK